MPDIAITVPTQALLTRIVNAFAKMPDREGNVWTVESGISKADHARKVHALLIARTVRATEMQEDDPDLLTIA